MAQTLPAFPYGAVYFRKSNPPRDDWERDYRTAAEDGMNVFRHWFMWSAIEVAPGVFDWEEYDQQFALAERHGLKTIVGEIAHAAPEWAFRRLAHARYVGRDGQPVGSLMRNSSVTGGFPGLCLDHDDAREAAGAFLTALVERYREHPALGAYDIWNECNLFSSAFPDCRCPATVARYREWLRAKYGDLRALGAAWYRHSYSEWDDVVPPSRLGQYPETLDWNQFRIDNAYRLLRWRVGLVRGLDPDHPVTAHGVAAAPLYRMAEAGDDHWRAAAEVDSYGFTWGAGRYGNEAWQQYHVVDIVRAGARGKPFWHTEATAGPHWIETPRQGGRSREDGRIPAPEDIRLWNLTSFAAGVRGLTYNRWRPLLDGPLFGSLGAYEMDGSRTARSAMAGRIATWANAPEQAGLRAARPVRGEVGIVFVPESSLFTAAQQGSSDAYADAARGAYRGFFDRNIQPDWVHIDDIDGYDFLYLPHPLMLPQRAAAALIGWVERGGSLVAEGCPGYFGDRGRVGTAQPNHGLDRLFGARQAHAEFTPDLLPEETIGVGAATVRCGLYLQTYTLAGGDATGHYQDGRIAAVDHTYGRGRTRLLGTAVGHSYRAGEGADFFAAILAWAGKGQHLCVNVPAVTARLQRGDDGLYLWLTNPTKAPLDVRAELGARWGPHGGAVALWGDAPEVEGRAIRATVGARDAVIARLTPA